MNEITADLIERPYPELVDDLLTAMAGGVVNEPLRFDLKVDLYPLAEPARGVRGISGTLEDEHHTFLAGVDFEFSEGDNAVVWLGEGRSPDDETTFYVDYFRVDSRSPLTDLNVGSVTRTLGEALGREMATLYQQVRLAYLSGFLDTAEGRSLDLVVSILGLTRKTGEFAEGLVTFFRAPEVTGNLTIPQGTVLATAEGEVLFETSRQRTLQRGQVRIDAPARAAEDFAGDAGLVAAGAITEMVAPLAGIARITNLEATTRAAEDETDEELRARARAALRALGKATLAALDRVIREGRGKPVQFWDPNSPPAQRSDPGTVAVLLEAEPERFPSLRGAVEETRAAGVLATVVARYVFFKLRLEAQLDPPLGAAGEDKVREEMIAALRAYAESLSSGDPAPAPKLLEALSQVKGIAEPKIKDAIAWRSDIGSPGPEPLVTALTEAALEVSAEEPGARREELAGALTAALAEASPSAPTGIRIPDRDLIQSTAEETAGQRATDAEIEAGEFQVSATVDGEPWFVVLDMEPADIAFTTAGEEEA